MVILSGLKNLITLLLKKPLTQDSIPQSKDLYVKIGDKSFKKEYRIRKV